MKHILNPGHGKSKAKTQIAVPNGPGKGDFTAEIGESAEGERIFDSRERRGTGARREPS